MPTIELYGTSGVTITNWRYNFFNSTGATWAYDFNAQIMNTNYSYLSIYSTAAPVPSGYVSGATLNTYTPLITWGPTAAQLYTPSYNSTNTDSSFTGKSIIDTIYKAATATGTASWFLYGNFNPFPTSPALEIIGTVGAPGSGADLIVGTTSIVSGSLYKASFSILLPLSWSW